MHHFRVKTAMATFWATFGITLAIFILTSGHTVRGGHFIEVLEGR